MPRPSLSVARALAATVALLALLACGEEAPIEPEPVPFCESNVTMQVTGGTTPTISWTPACRVTRITVYQGTDTLWYIRHADGVEPGVAYGASVYGAQVYNEPRPLVAGQAYEVRAWLIQGAAPRYFGATTYTP